MFAYPLRATALALTAALGLSACAYNGFSSGVSLGYGSGYGPYYGAGYGYPLYGAGYGYSPYWGWYDGFYYPGSGFYVYDRYRTPYRWTDAQRRYWSIRRERALASSTTSNPVIVRQNWSDFDRDRAKTRADRIERASRPVRVERASRPVRVERTSRPAVTEREETRASKAAARAQRRSEIRTERASRSNGRRVGVIRQEQD